MPNDPLGRVLKIFAAPFGVKAPRAEKSQRGSYYKYCPPLRFLSPGALTPKAAPNSLRTRPSTPGHTVTNMKLKQLIFFGLDHLFGQNSARPAMAAFLICNKGIALAMAEQQSQKDAVSQPAEF